MAAQIWTNIIAYALQIGLLVGVGAALPVVLRIKSPAARLRYWQLLLVACLALPWVRPWHTEVIAMNAMPTAATTALAPLQNAAPVNAFPTFSQIAFWLLAAGVVARLVWLTIGLLKLSRYRRNGRAIPLPSEWTGAVGDSQLLLSDEVSGPVTFGFFHPVVLLPESFSSMPESMRDAILFHELLHVQRRDWLYTLGEEFVRAVFWFHPAIWWVLGEIQLAREQTVDLAVIEMTQARDPYVDTLLAMAGVNPQLDLAPAPLFLRRRHLKQRVMGIVQEVRMSKTRLIVMQTAALAAMAAACWVVTGAIPLQAQAQLVVDGPGVTVNLNGSQLMHRSGVPYPSQAAAKGVEGTVVVQVRLDNNGEVLDAAILSGPDELRKSVQQSVLNWHFDKSAGSSTRVVNIDFVKPANVAAGNSLVTTVPTPEAATRVQVMVAPGAPATASGASGRMSLQQPMLGGINALRQQNPALADPANIGSIEILGLSDSARDQLMALLPVHVGDLATGESMSKLSPVVRQFDSHLLLSVNRPSASSAWAIQIRAPEASPVATSAQAAAIPAGAQRIGGNVMAANLISSAKPIYPPLAKMARQQGTVKFQATIGKDGTVEDLLLISGPPLLIPSAMEAVRQWVYKPTLLNGVPVEVVTTVDVNYSLADGPPPAPAQ